VDTKEDRPGEAALALYRDLLITPADKAVSGALNRPPSSAVDQTGAHHQPTSQARLCKSRLKVYLDLKDEKYSLRQMVIVADQAGHDGMTTKKILAALDKPRKLYSILMVVNPSGSMEELQQKLLKMRDEGLVKFDIHKGRWSRET
jgi:hypothetical protein